ncbi:filamentous hemagglutinin family outer membrane protein [Stanieria cyanosphaera PCC 7437]|uniref:Filamentous hemagglutinin family outer membrane protein n=1 Tax=Stanieria cyanosphaera (strain ATCC 29371 / PCC 7437) TaxID=111780 RepID=K9XUD8_STAC7|nr:filamentous hemagglutinin N-terminal domain-containing protein [Stanieria cyanosphaera]AFZ36215.1 filamentous hemagglutinin family outer membrane protein [Stanieria cyanosphaera PCC 7437]
MKLLAWQTIVFSSLSVSLFLALSPAQAQITPDNTVDTQVNQTNNVWQIDGGQTRAGNLFHSFENFSLPTNQTAFFNNSAQITNIISRVTGGALSSIDGLIKANGVANLILINPNGIQFGANARLDIGGSFMGSTASSVKFADGTFFSANELQTPPLLTVSVPVGLQWGQGNGAIKVTGEGHNLSEASVGFSPFIRGEVNGLEVKPNQTLALLGNGITLEGGTLTAEGGKIELGSVANGLVNFNFSDQGLTFSYENVANFANLEMRSLALVDTSGTGSGTINLQGKNISLTDGSVALILNEGEQPAGQLTAEATESITISGTNLDGEIGSGLYTEAISSGKGADIIIKTGQLSLQTGGAIFADTFSSGAGGNVRIDASNSIAINGFSSINPNTFSIITSTTFGSGDAGDVTISTQRLTAFDGGNLTSTTGGLQGTGSGGNVLVNASELVELVGVTPGVFTPSQITAGTGGTGNAGTVTINTQKLVLRDGGRIDASTLASGNAGSVTVNASDAIEVSGTVPNSLNPSLIISSANLVDKPLRELLQLPDAPSGNSGDVTLNTPKLNITDGAQVTVRNDTVGNAGTLRVNADNIFLSNQGSITATTKDGIGGNIELEAKTVQLNNGLINASVLGSGGGGTIKIKASELVDVFGSGNQDLRENIIFPIIQGTVDQINPTQGIIAVANSNGKPGSISIDTNRFNVINGGLVVSSTLGSQPAGNIDIQAKQVDVATSLLVASTFGSGNAGNITIDTEKLNISDGGEFLVTTFASGNAGNLTVRAKDSVELVGRSPGDGLFASGLVASSEAQPVPAEGNSGNLSITTSQLTIKDGATASINSLGFGNGGTLKINADSVVLENQGTLQATTTFGQGGNIQINADTVLINQGLINGSTFAQGRGGNIEIKASDSLQIIGSGLDFLQENFISTQSINLELLQNIDLVTVLQGILAGTAGEGDAGNITITTQQLQLNQGGLIGTATIGSGNAGSVFINTESLLADGGIISASTLATGTSGDVTVNTNNLTLRNGGQIVSSTLANGDAGNLTINADEFVELSGSAFNGNFPSALSAGGQPLATATGNGGNLTITTPQLKIEDGALVSVSSIGSGNAGTLSIKANSLFLDNQSAVSASTASGTGGDILLTIADEIQLRNTSLISAQAGGIGNGGNISIDSGAIALLENSGIEADANQGMGGNIQLDTLGLFVCQTCRISASSNLGVDGIIDIITPAGEANLEIVDLPLEFNQVEEVVELSCQPNKNQIGSQFVITGRNGLPPRPSDPLSSPALTDFDNNYQADNLNHSQPASNSPLPPPALGWYVNSQGVVVLSANPSDHNPGYSGLNSPNCQSVGNSKKDY